MKLKTFTFYLLSSLLFTLGAKAQEQKIEDPIALVNKVHSAIWQPLSTLSNLDVFYKYVQCDDDLNGIHKERVFLSFKNPTNLPVHVEYDLVLWYNQKCYNCDANDGEYHHSLIIPANSSVDGSCISETGEGLAMLSKFIGMPNQTTQLTNFSIRNIKVYSK